MAGRGKSKPRGRGKGRGTTNARSPTTPPSPQQQEVEVQLFGAETAAFTESAARFPTSFQSNSRDTTPQSRRSPSPLAKKVKVVSSLTDDQEEAMVEWLVEHPEFYNKKLSHYKNTTSKIARWEAKAQELELDYLSINTLYKSLRTRYGKLKMKKSGDGAAELTDLENWLLQKFTFLDGHIHRVKTRPLVSFKAKIAETTAVDDEIGEVNDDVTETTDTTPKSSIDRPSRSSKGKAKSSSAADGVDELVRKMTERVESSRQLQERVLAMPKVTERTTFGDFLRSER